MIYVDSAFIPYRRMLMCHMMADNVEELHLMALRIGVKRKWFQDHKFPHYDICKSMREKAIKYGAKVVTTKEMIKLMRKK